MRPQVRNILLVGLDNVCRTPIAQAFFRHHVREITVHSAGLQAPPLEPPAPVVISAARHWGLHIDDHRSQLLSDTHCDYADLILAMESWHAQAIQRMYPQWRAKVFTLGHMRRTEIEAPGFGDRHGLLRTAEHIGRCVHDWLQPLNRLRTPD